MISTDKIIKCENIGREGGTYIKYIIENYDILEEYTIFLQGKIHDHIINTSIEQSFNKLIEIINEEKNYNFKYLSTLMVRVKPQEFIDYTSGLPALPLIEIPEISVNIIIDFIQKYISNTTLDVEEEIKLLKIIHILLTFKKDISNDNCDVNEELTIQKGLHKIKKYELCKILDDNEWNIEPVRTKLFSLFCHDIIFEKIYKNSNNYTYGSGALFISSRESIHKIQIQQWKEIYSTMQMKSPPSGYGLEKMWRYLLDYNH